MFTLQNVDDVLNSFDTKKEGLSVAQIEERRAQYGWNEFPSKKRSMILLFLSQFKSILIYILFGALILSIVLPFYESHGALRLSDFMDAIAIGTILFFNAILGFSQEKKAEDAIEMLHAMSEPSVRVRRAGSIQVIHIREIIPGDILLLEEGDKISADGRVIMSRSAKVNEASLTGESEPEIKIVDALTGNPTFADQTNMVFRGTIVIAGHMEVCITAIGLHTEIGKVAELVSSVEHPSTPLEKSMSVLGKWLGIIVLFFCSMIFVVGIIRGLEIPTMLLAAASLAVSAVPEGLPAIVTVTLAIGVQRMIKRNALTREMQAIETLGSVTVICTDKTGTITENRMDVEDMWTIIDDDTSLLLTIAASCNNAHSLEVGDPTEVGLLKKAEEEGIERLEIISEDVPFSAETKYMMTRNGGIGIRDTGHETEDKDYPESRTQSPESRYFLKGAPEVIVDLCDVTDQERQVILKQNASMAGNALRVLGFAWKNIDEEKAHFVGLIGLMDPPRSGVKKAIAVARRAGIRTIMITGDHAITAKAIAAKVGIVDGVISGERLSSMSDEEFSDCVKHHSIFARISPVQKVQILTGLQSSGEIVAMGGDGVNDAPALKKAHVGFAMGERGTDVARETAEMILTDDNYSTVVSAIEEGRTIYDNIRKFVVFLLRANFDELMVVFGSILVGLPLPYLPVHILIRNLVIESFPAMALAMEKPEANVMQRPPRDAKKHILHGEIGFIILAATIATIAAFHMFLYGLRVFDDVDTARTIVVTGSILFELTLVFTCRSKDSLLHIGIFSNHYLLAAVSFAFALLLLFLYSPLNIVLHLVPLTLNQWILPVAWSVGALLFFEGLKIVRR